MYDVSPVEVSAVAVPLSVLMQRCAPQIHPNTLTRLVMTESGANPYAIGVVGGRLERQPRNHQEAVATARALQRQGVNFSAGLGQINLGNWRRLGLNEHSVFEPCSNLRAAQAVLWDCFNRAPSWRRGVTPAQAPTEPSPTEQRTVEQQALRQAFSCYYSGNYSTGFDHGYVAKVVGAQPQRLPRAPQSGASSPQVPVRRSLAPGD